jgi:hypothetical protein
MSITIYWASNDREWLRATTPELIYKNFSKDIKNQEQNLTLCPATKNYMKNTFSIKSLYNYDFRINDFGKGKELVTDTYDQKFFDEHMQVRSIENKLFSFIQRFVFFTEEKSLLMSAGVLPFLEDNNITKRCVVIPGTFDIGKWFRQSDFAFYLKKDYDDFKIEENEIFQYIKFHTDEKIIFKQFRVNEKIQDFLNDIENAKENRKGKIRPLQEYYLMMKNKKMIIKEIKNNLLDQHG